jgi:hypothetical protein
MGDAKKKTKMGHGGHRFSHRIWKIGIMVQHGIDPLLWGTVFVVLIWIILLYPVLHYSSIPAGFFNFPLRLGGFA